MTRPLFIEALGREGPQVFKHLCVEMLQGSKGGSHSCWRNWSFKVPCPRVALFVCVLELKLTSGSSARAHALGHMPFLSGFPPEWVGPRRVFTQAQVLRKNGVGMTITCCPFFCPYIISLGPQIREVLSSLGDCAKPRCTCGMWEAPEAEPSPGHQGNLGMPGP